MLGEVGIDGGLKLSHRGEASPANCLCGDPSKETLDQVEPGTARGREMKVKAWMTEQPAVDLGGFVGGIVVDDEMKLAFAIVGESGLDTL